jgi:hypothetical protein
MSDNVVIPVSVGELFHPDETRTVAGGGTRIVRMVPVGKGHLPCIWRSRKITEGRDGQENPIKVNACLLLACKDPPTVLPAEVQIDMWSTFPEGIVEW